MAVAPFNSASVQASGRGLTVSWDAPTGDWDAPSFYEDNARLPILTVTRGATNYTVPVIASVGFNAQNNSAPLEANYSNSTNYLFALGLSAVPGEVILDTDTVTMECPFGTYYDESDNRTAAVPPGTAVTNGSLVDDLPGDTGSGTSPGDLRTILMTPWGVAPSVGEAAVSAVQVATTGVDRVQVRKVGDR
jgi:hypothetical protein